MTKKIENFIAAVKEYPILYNMALPDFKDTKKKDYIWDNEISVKMNGESGDLLKSKWKNLRDTYQKHLRANKLTKGQSVNETKNKNLATYKKWQWASHMEYLKEHLSFAETISNVHEPAQDEDNETNDLLNSTESTFEKNEVVISESPKKQRKKFKGPSQKNTEKDPQCSNVDKVLEHSQKKRKTSHNNVMEGIELLMMGHAKTIKKFSARRQAIAKTKIAKLIGELELEQLDEDSSQQHLPTTSSSSRSSQYP
ncbi:MADF domain [Cinara cedri]|uniref:MADF domain n=1 Tax=Cinara cedri TaxID=506608 RepID=A0A5E4N941_9HEMI|nr:MADF domain [Cinara cedri]